MTPIKVGTQSFSVQLHILDSATFLPITTLTNGSAGAALWYKRGGTGTKTAISLAALASDEAAYAEGGFKHIANGVYRLDVPNAALLAGADYVVIGGTFTGAIVPPLALRLVGHDPRTELTTTVLAYIDAAITSRLATAGYTAPDNSGITAVKAKTDKLNFNSDATPLVLSDVRDVNDAAVTSVADFKADVSALALEASVQAVPTVAEIRTELDTNSAKLDATVSSRSSHSAADVVTAMDGTSAKLDVAVSSRLADADYTAPDSAADIADAVHDEALSGHVAAGSTGAALNRLGAIQTRTDMIGVASVTIRSPLVTGSAVSLVRGDDYAADDGRSLDFTFENAPDLTGATITFSARTAYGESHSFAIEAEVLSADEVRVELTSEDTEVLLPGVERYRFDIQAELDGTARVVTLVAGKITVIEDMIVDIAEP
ncbi:hypothetical protein FJZ36_15175 [Candidatus Poribacteria bacterium]|nr:hypothetical protein [Candidatus Poribacteria bacterium]